MAMFPKIDSPCPYKDKADFAAMMDGDFCRMCKRQVIDIGGWSDDERIAFLAGCSEEVCVSYKLPLRPALAAAALAAGMAMVPAAAAAQDVAAPTAEPGTQASEVSVVLTIGGIRDPRAVEYVETADVAGVPELPVVYEDEPSTRVPAKDSGRATGPI